LSEKANELGVAAASWAAAGAGGVVAPSLRSEAESSGVPALPNVKTARRWRGIVAFTHLAREGRMTVTIGRRELLAALGGAAVAWPLAASAERATRVTSVKQIRLTERQIQGFIAAQKEMAVVAEFGQRDPRLQTESDTVANKNGFKDFAEYDEVAANILMVFAGIDPQSKQYTDPQTAIKKQIAQIIAGVCPIE
jgi:hypothetical protein